MTLIQPVKQSQSIQETNVSDKKKKKKIDIVVVPARAKRNSFYLAIVSQKKNDILGLVIYPEG